MSRLIALVALVVSCAQTPPPAGVDAASFRAVDLGAWDAGSGGGHVGLP
jgi:hypothetical protein